MEKRKFTSLLFCLALVFGCSEPNGEPGRGIENSGALSKRNVSVATGAIIGGVAGGAVGSGVGSTLAMVAGGVAGAKLANQANQPHTPEKQPMPTRYCYRVLQDILCYRDQMKGWEAKLVGYQGKDAAPPVASSMQPIPLRTEEANSGKASKEEKAKPIFVNMPTDPKETKGSNTESMTVEGAHETLTDSPLGPQL